MRDRRLECRDQRWGYDFTNSARQRQDTKGGKHDDSKDETKSEKPDGEKGEGGLDT